MPRNSDAAAPPGVDLVVFDCDGVLVDSEVLACRAVVETLAAFGHAVAAESIAERFIGVSNRDMYAALAVDTGGKLPEGFDAAMKRCALELFDRELNPIAASLLHEGIVEAGHLAPLDPLHRHLEARVLAPQLGHRVVGREGDAQLARLSDARPEEPLRLVLEQRTLGHLEQDALPLRAAEGSALDGSLVPPGIAGALAWIGRLKPLTPVAERRTCCVLPGARLIDGGVAVTVKS